MHKNYTLLQSVSIHKRAYLSISVTSSSGTGLCGSSGAVILGVLRGLIQDPASELPRIPIPRTPVNRGKDRSEPAPIKTPYFLVHFGQ
jgi:hypothetical protein